MNGIAGEKAKRGVMLLVVCSLLAIVAGCGSDDSGEAGDSTSAQGTSTETSGQFASLPTKKCRTSEGLELPDVPLDSTTVVPVPADSVGGLAAFANTTGSILLGPADWKCDSLVAVNGDETIGLSPDGKDPFREGAEVGITYDASVACQGCIAAKICAVLPNSQVVRDYAEIGVGCDRKKPLEETLTPIGEFSVLFDDPPGVRGQGVPSGGSVSSEGMLTYSETRGSQQVSCAVPEELADLCPSIVAGSMLHALTYAPPG